MLALQGTLTVASFHCVPSSMDEHALGSGHSSPSGSMGWGARAPALQHQPSHRGDLGSIGLSEHSQARAHPSRPSSAHPAYQHHEHSPSPTSSSPSSGFAQPHAHEHRQGIAPQPMRYSFTHPGGWPDSPHRFRARGSIGSATGARTSSYLRSTSSQEHLGKRKRPASAEGGTAILQTIATHRDSVGPQRSHRRHHNVAEKTHSTLLPSGGMYMTFPLDIPSPEPDTESSAPAGPPPFQHGPTELPPRPYEAHGRIEAEGSGPERPAKRGRLPADVMDHLPTIEGRLHKIEVAVQDYLDARNRRALEKSKLPDSQ